MCRFRVEGVKFASRFDTCPSETRGIRPLLSPECRMPRAKVMRLTLQLQKLSIRSRSAQILPRLLFGVWGLRSGVWGLLSAVWGLRSSFWVAAIPPRGGLLRNGAPARLPFARRHPRAETFAREAPCETVCAETPPRESAEGGCCPDASRTPLKPGSATQAARPLIRNTLRC